MTKPPVRRPTKSSPSPVASARDSSAGRSAKVVGRLVLPDQLATERIVAEHDRAVPLVVPESREWLSRRPYHRQRIALILLNLRACVAELREAELEVELLRSDAPMSEAVAAWCATRGEGVLEGWMPAEREMRQEFAELESSGCLRWTANPFFLVDRAIFDRSQKAGGPYRMDAFYRAVRQSTGILMDLDGRPVGGKYSFDHDNRKPWSGTPPAPMPPRFARSALRDEVEAEIHARYSEHPGVLDLEALPATHEEVQALWSWAKRECLQHFGPFEDAMSRESRGLFHTRIAPALNLGRIHPRQLVDEVAAMDDLPLASREGFIRQVIGWREFVRHVHEATDGHRQLRGHAAPIRSRPGDGGFATWSGRPWQAAAPPTGVDGGSDANAIAAGHRVPPAFWGTESGLACLDRVVADVWQEGWSHHITRLMVLGNIATLLDLSPRDLADWFWIAYTDAWEWVVEPNVMGMATWGLGGLMTTKPYVAGAAYLDRMSDFCSGCRFKPKPSAANACPLTRLYWAFLDRHEPLLRDNHRLGVVLQAMRKRSEDERRRDRATFVRVQSLLLEGRPLPADVACREGES